MSAFMCSDHHIAVLAAYAVKFCHWRPSIMAPGETRSNAELLGEKLFQENVLSLQARYAMRGSFDDPPYKHSRSALLEATRLPAVQIIKSAQCYRHQANEHDGWGEGRASSDANQITEAIIERAIEALPGYEEAKWGMPDPARQPPEPAQSSDLYHAKLQEIEHAIEFEHDDYLRVVSTSAKNAKRFFGRDDEPVDLGPAAANGRWKEGSRVWGFRVQPDELAAELDHCADCDAPPDPGDVPQCEGDHT